MSTQTDGLCSSFYSLIDGAKSFTQMAFVPMTLLQKFLNSKNTKDDPVIFFGITIVQHFGMCNKILFFIKGFLN